MLERNYEIVKINWKYNLCAHTIVAVIFCLIAPVLKLGDCRFSYGACFYAAMSNAVILGGAGLLCYSMVDNIALAYMIPFLYYAASMGSGKNYLKKFWLFGYSTGENIGDKGWLLAAGILLIAAALVIREKRRA